MSSMTIEQLKAVLQSEGVPLAGIGTRKGDYLKAYKKLQKSGTGHFSSDDEMEDSSANITLNSTLEDLGIASDSSTSGSANGKLLGSEMDPDFVPELDDATLRELLIARGVNLGPIVGSTRRFYELMFIDHLKKENASRLEESHVNGSGDAPMEHVGNGNGYSTDEEVPELTIRRQAPRKSVTPKKVTTASADTSASESTHDKPSEAWNDDDESGSMPYNTTPVKKGLRSKTRRTGTLFSDRPSSVVSTSIPMASTRSSSTRVQQDFANSTQEQNYEASQAAEVVPKLSRKYDSKRNVVERTPPSVGFVSAMAFVAVILAIGCYYMILYYFGTRELTEDERINQDLDEVLRNLEAKRQASSM